MSDKKSGTPSRKRVNKVLQEEDWNCSVCTFKNSPEAFKCSMCDVRKGTSTRKPRLNQHIVAQQEATRLVAQMPHSPTLSTKEETSSHKTKHEHDTKASKTRLKDIDRSNPITMAVTVNDVTVVFTEYRQPKKHLEREEKGKKS